MGDGHWVWVMVGGCGWWLVGVGDGRWVWVMVIGVGMVIGCG